jgi:cytochrome c553
MFNHRSLSSPIAVLALASFLALGLSQGAKADEGERRSQIPLLPSYKAECAACHVAFPPGMLPGASWKRLMSNLPKHFGTDASLDPAQVKVLSTWLSANAAKDGRAMESSAQDRITRSAWFTRQHDEVPTATWKRASIKSASNCAACHTRADQGEFNEDDVRIPR